MTRVSDTAAFADAVADGGGLPFLALALLRKAETRKAAAKPRPSCSASGPGASASSASCRRRSATSSSTAIRAAQAAVRHHRRRPAGPGPASSKQHGIPTYLHVPSPGLLRLFLKDGARRFIFEGRECGGHVGPRASFALWEAMVEVLLETSPPARPADDLHVVFAGGIHDGLSAAMVAALAAALAEKGVKVGVLLGTAYLFTHGGRRRGAVTRCFQRAAVPATTRCCSKPAPATPPLHPDALRRRVRGREGAAGGRRAARPRRCSTPWSG